MSRGCPDRDFYYLIGVRIGNGESAVQHSLWADTVEDEGKIWREFLDHPRNRREAGSDSLRQLRNDFPQTNARTLRRAERRVMCCKSVAIGASTFCQLSSHNSTFLPFPTASRTSRVLSDTDGPMLCPPVLSPSSGGADGRSPYVKP